MKIISTIDIKTSIQQFTSTTTQYIDGRMKAGYANISPYLLSPQWLAGYNGLKKLVEKDYCNEEENIAGSLISS